MNDIQLPYGIRGVNAYLHDMLMQWDSLRHSSSLDEASYIWNSRAIQLLKSLEKA